MRLWPGGTRTRVGGQWEHGTHFGKSTGITPRRWAASQGEAHAQGTCSNSTCCMHMRAPPVAFVPTASSYHPISQPTQHSHAHPHTNTDTRTHTRTRTRTCTSTATPTHTHANTHHTHKHRHAHTHTRRKHRDKQYKKQMRHDDVDSGRSSGWTGGTPAPATAQSRIASCSLCAAFSLASAVPPGSNQHLRCQWPRLQAHPQPDCAHCKCGGFAIVCLEKLAPDQAVHSWRVSLSMLGLFMDVCPARTAALVWPPLRNPPRKLRAAGYCSWMPQIGDEPAVLLNIVGGIVAQAPPGDFHQHTVHRPSGATSSRSWGLTAALRCLAPSDLNITAPATGDGDLTRLARRSLRVVEGK